MLYILLVIVLILAGYFGVRYFLLKRSLDEANDDLCEIIGELGENRIVKLPSPDKNIEALLETINIMLEGIRKESVKYGRQELALKLQIESISHDLRTPLTSIQGYLALIDTSRLDIESIEALEVVNRKADSLQRLIVQFYELSQLKHEVAQCYLYTHDVALLLRETLATHYRMLSESKLEVILEIPETPVKGLAEPGALERIFVNLIENASRYAQTVMKIELHSNEKQVQVVFSNDCDLAKEIDPKELFVPFYVGHSSRPQGSSGLGLAIARHLAENMNAKLEATLARNEEGQTIHISLTLQR